MSVKAINAFCVPEEAMDFSDIGDTPKDCLVNTEAVNRRQIHIVDEITNFSFEQVKNLYDKLIEEDDIKPIYFVIGSPGGSASAMLGIMNIILLSKTPCYTVLLSETCSAGSWIYLCGHKRFAPKTSLVSFMLHPLSWGNSQEALGTHNSYNKYIERLSTSLIEFTAKQTKIPIRKLKKLATTDTQFFIGEELFEFGIATDELTTSSFWLQPKDKKIKKSIKVVKAVKIPKTTEDSPQLLME